MPSGRGISVSSTAGSHAAPGRSLRRTSDSGEGPVDRHPWPHASCTTASSVLGRADGSTVWPRRSACTANPFHEVVTAQGAVGDDKVPAHRLMMRSGGRGVDPECPDTRLLSVAVRHSNRPAAARR